MAAGAQISPSKAESHPERTAGGANGENPSDCLECGKDCIGSEMLDAIRRCISKDSISDILAKFESRISSGIQNSFWSSHMPRGLRLLLSFGHVPSDSHGKARVYYSKLFICQNHPDCPIRKLDG